MSIERVRAYLEPFGVADRIEEFDVSSATVELAAEALSCEPGGLPKPSRSMWGRRLSWS